MVAKHSEANSISIMRKIRCRKYSAASDIEKSIVDWIIGNSDGYYEPDDAESVLLSRQYLSQSAPKELYYLIRFPEKYVDYPFFYVVGLESPDNPAVLGVNRIGDDLNVYDDWYIEGYKVMSTVIDGVWIGFIFQDGQYIENVPSLSSTSPRHRVPAERQAKPTTAK